MRLRTEQGGRLGQVGIGLLAVMAEGDVYAVAFPDEGERCYGLDGDGFALRLSHEQAREAARVAADVYGEAEVVHYVSVPAGKRRPNV